MQQSAAFLINLYKIYKTPPQIGAAFFLFHSTYHSLVGPMRSNILVFCRIPDYLTSTIFRSIIANELNLGENHAPTPFSSGYCTLHYFWHLFWRPLRIRCCGSWNSAGIVCSNSQSYPLAVSKTKKAANLTIRGLILLLLLNYETMSFLDTRSAISPIPSCVAGA